MRISTSKFRMRILCTLLTPGKIFQTVVSILDLSFVRRVKLSSHHHLIFNSLFFSLTELSGFRMVIVFTTPRHFVQSHASCFTSQFFFSSSSTCFFLGFVLFFYYPALQISEPLSHFHLSSKRDRTTAYYLL